jgi:hypothetical protein
LEIQTSFPYRPSPSNSGFGFSIKFEHAVSVFYFISNWTDAMATTKFVRRVNEDSTTEVICLKCFQTIAKRWTGDGRFLIEELIEEREHHCGRVEEKQLQYASPPGAF